MTTLLLSFSVVQLAEAKGHDKKTPASPPIETTPADAPASGDTSANRAAPTIESELQQLRDELAAQRAALGKQQQRIALLETQLRGTPVGTATPAATASQPIVSGVALPPNGQKEGTGQISITQPEHPLSFKIGAADFTPGGFADLVAVVRSTNVGSGLGTNFSTLPYNNTTPQSRLSEFRLTAQSSRLSLKVDAKVNDSTRLSGYVESDFNGTQPANVYTSTNGASLRLRLYWVDIQHDKWEVVGGQTWSLLTPNRAGLSPLPLYVFTTVRLDTNYLAGLVFARQPGLRVIYHPTSTWTLGAAVENPEQFVPSSVVFPGAAGFFSGQFDNASSSTSAASATTNPATPNLHPDVIVKSAFDWKIAGRAFHLEAAGVVRSFKVFNNLVTPNTTNTITGGGGSFNLNLELLKDFHVIANTFYGDGVGRYIGALGPDVVVRPNGSLSGVHAGSGLAGFEWQVRPNFLVDGYYSGAYFQRNFARLASTATPAPACAGVSGFTCVGFGFPGNGGNSGFNPTAANRAYQEATIGFIPTLWSSADYGKVQIISQYSYVVRSPWDPGTVGTPPVAGPKNAHAFLGYAGIRYIIP